MRFEPSKRPGRRVHPSAVGRFSGAPLVCQRLFRPPLPSPSLPPLPRAEEGRNSGARRTGGSASPLPAPVDLSAASSSSSCWRRRGGARSRKGFTPKAKMKTTRATTTTATTTTKSSGVSTSTTSTTTTTTMETTSSLSPTALDLLLQRLRSAPKRWSTCS